MDLVKRFRVKHGSKFRLSDFDPADTAGLDIDKDEAKQMLALGITRLRALQERLYAEGRWALLLVFQAMDAAGKDSAIEHVMTGINPQGCDVRSFKTPSAEELRHDFLWRTTRALPEEGRIGIFNRSYYEEVLVVRVHPELLAEQKLPTKLITKDIWAERFESIRNFESHLVRNGTVPLKFFLYVSRAEQKRRFLERIEDREKWWKFSPHDVAEREHWDQYMDAYEDMIRNTAVKHAPWHVIPADNKWFARLVIAATIVDALERLDLNYPKVEGPDLEAMREAEATLRAENGSKPQRSKKGNGGDRSAKAGAPAA
jgi:PPK2 family polyphosphate:nucleotide phosphotransferase